MITFLMKECGTLEESSSRLYNTSQRRESLLVFLLCTLARQSLREMSISYKNSPRSIKFRVVPPPPFCQKTIIENSNIDDSQASQSFRAAGLVPANQTMASLILLVSSLEEPPSNELNILDCGQWDLKSGHPVNRYGAKHRINKRKPTC